MSILDIRIGSKHYQVACDDGQEPHLRQLAKELDLRVRDLSARMGGQVPDSTLLVLTALMLMDETADAKDKMKKLKDQMGNTSQSFEIAKQTELELAVANAFILATEDVEQLVERMQQNA